MSLKRFNSEQLTAYLETLNSSCDGVRLVNPSECRIFSAKPDGTISYGPHCYNIWKISSRCANCSSLKALETEKDLDKDEEKEGSIYHIHSTPIELELENGTIHQCVIEQIKVTPPATPRQSSARTDSRISRERFADVLTYVVHNMQSGIACFNLAGQCIYANAEVFRMFECPDNLDALQDVLYGWIRHNPDQSSSWRQIYQKDNERKTFEIQQFPLTDHLNKQIGYYYFFFDRSEEAKRFDSEHYQATHDELTQVLNRYGFYNQARQTLEENPDGRFLLLVSNIRDFKLFNELFGYRRGNDLLVTIADAIRTTVRHINPAVIGRLQSDRFALLIKKENCHTSVLIEEMNRITDMFASDSFSIRNHVGIYEVTDPSVPVAVMCDRATISTKTIQENGENAFARYSEHMLEQSLRDLSVISEFHDALKDKQFQIYLQPQISSDNQLIGAEALCRWIHPTRGVLPPGEFIPVLEEYGQIHYLDRYIWEEAVKQIHAWEDTDKKDLFLSVNISMKDFYFLDIYKEITNLVEQYGISPKKLKLEITESFFMRNSRKTIDLIRRLQKYGFEVEIDDFGSGYSSLNLLKDLKADILKIDMEFLRETENKSRSKTILNAVIAMAKQLGMPVVSEGVETPAQVKYLREIGCDIFQGYYFSKPIPVSDFEEKYFPE